MNHLTQAGLIKEYKHNQLKVHLNSVYGVAVKFTDIRPHSTEEQTRITEIGQRIIRNFQNTIGNNE